MKQLHFVSLIVFSTLTASAETKMSLDDFLKAVRAENLSLKTETAKEDAASARATGIALPPPMVGAIQMKEKSGDTASGFEISQTIPFPSKLAGERSARKFEAEAQKEDRKAKEQEVLTEARLLYFSLWAAQERLSLLREKKSVIERHIRLSQAAARSDSFLKIHVLKAESDLDSLDNEILSEDQGVRQKQAEMAEFINANPASFLPAVVEPALSPLPSPAALEKPYQLESSRLSLESLRSRESEAQASWFPELNVRYKKMAGSMMIPEYSEVMLGVSLPFLYFWEPRAASRSATADRLQGELAYSRETRRVETVKTIARTKAEALKKQLENLKGKLLPRAEQRMRLVHNLAPRDIETLEDHRETMESFPDLKLKALELRIQYEEAVANLDKYAAERGSHE